MNIAHLPSKADMTLEDLFITVYCFVEESYYTVLLFQCPDIRFPPTDFFPGGLCGFIILIELKKAKIVSLNRRGGCTLRR